MSAVFGDDLREDATFRALLADGLARGSRAASAPAPSGPPAPSASDSACAAATTRGPSASASS